MTGETELERMVVRLIGDGSSYRDMMAEAQRSTMSATSTITTALRTVENTSTNSGNVLTGVVDGMQDSLKNMAVGTVDVLTKFTSLDTLEAEEQSKALIESFKMQAETFGMTSREADIYKSQLSGATEAEIEQLQVLNSKLEALEEEKALQLRGQQITENVATSEERYQKQVEQLNEMLRKGAIDQETYNRAMEQAKDHADDAASSFGHLGNVLAQMAVVGGGLLWLQHGVGEWQIAEDTATKLTAVLEANGRQVQETLKDYQDFAAGMQRVTVLGDDTVLAILKTAESFGLTGDAAKKAVTDAIGLAAINDSSAEAMIRLTAAMARGDTQQAMMFSRMVPQLRGVKDESEFLAKYQLLVASGMKAANAEASTASGIMRQLANDYGDFMEEVGKIVSTVIRPFVKLLTEAVHWFQSLSDGAKVAIVAFAGLTAGTIALGAALSATRAVLNSAFGVVGPLLRVIGLIAGAVGIWVNYMGGLDAAWESIEKTTGGVWSAIKEKASAFWQWFQPIWKAVSGLISTIWTDVIKPVFSAVWDFIKTVFGKVGEFIAGVWRYVFGETEINWKRIREVIIEAIIVAEFTIKNFGLSWAVQWRIIALGASKAFDWIKDAFIAVISFVGAGVRSIGEFFVILWESIASGSTDAFNNMGRRFSDVFKNTFDSIAVALGGGESGLTRMLKDELDKAMTAMMGPYMAFRQQRLAQIFGNDKDKDEARRAGTDLGGEFAKGVTQEMGKLEATLRYEAEGLSRIAAYIDRLREQRTSGAGGAGGAGGPGAAPANGPAPAAAVPTETSPAMTGNEMKTFAANVVTLLTAANVLLTDIKNKPAEIVLVPGGGI